MMLRGDIGVVIAGYEVKPGHLGGEERPDLGGEFRGAVRGRRGACVERISIQDYSLHVGDQRPEGVKASDAAGAVSVMEIRNDPRDQCHPSNVGRAAQTSNSNAAASR
jgi:hypothetical protein